MYKSQSIDGLNHHSICVKHPILVFLHVVHWQRKKLLLLTPPQISKVLVILRIICTLWLFWALILIDISIRWHLSRVSDNQIHWKHDLHINADRKGWKQNTLFLEIIQANKFACELICYSPTSLAIANCNIEPVDKPTVNCSFYTMKTK